MSESVRFDRMGTVNGETVYALRIDGVLVRDKIPMEEVLRIISSRGEPERKAADDV